MTNALHPFGFIWFCAKRYEVAVALPPSWPIAQIVLRLDGSGPPQALKSGKILLEVKIMAVTDVVESMISRRPYRPGLGLDAALEEIAQKKIRFSISQSWGHV